MLSPVKAAIAESVSDDAAAAHEEARAQGWRRASRTPSLAEVFGSIKTRPTGPLWRKLLAFLGPGYLVAVGYMDPGNWATSLAGGSKFGYALLFIALLSNIMAIILQALCARLGDRAQSPVRHSARDRRDPHRARRVPHLVDAAARLPLCRGLHRHHARRHRRLLRHPDRHGRSRLGPGDPRLRADRRDREEPGDALSGARHYRGP